MSDRLVPYLMVAAIVFALALGLFCEGCHDGCEPEDTRCRGAAVQECASDGDWYEVIDCSDVGPDPWECCETAMVWDGSETAGCVPAGECAE